MKTFDRQDEIRLRMTQIARRQNDIETYTSMTYFRTKTESTRLRIARMTRIIIANIIREIRAIRSFNHKVQSSMFKAQCSKVKGKRVQIIKFKVPSSMFKVSCF